MCLSHLNPKYHGGCLGCTENVPVALKQKDMFVKTVSKIPSYSLVSHHGLKTHWKFVPYLYRRRLLSVSLNVANSSARVELFVQADSKAFWRPGPSCWNLGCTWAIETDRRYWTPFHKLVTKLCMTKKLQGKLLFGFAIWGEFIALALGPIRILFFWLLGTSLLCLWGPLRWLLLGIFAFLLWSLRRWKIRNFICLNSTKLNTVSKR